MTDQPMTIEEAREHLGELRQEAARQEPDRCPYGWVRSGDIHQALTTLLAYAKARDEEVERWEAVAKRSYKGRQIADRKELKEAYCGSCSYEIHKSQMQDPNSWVHSSVGRWLAVANRTALGGTP